MKTVDIKCAYCERPVDRCQCNVIDWRETAANFKAESKHYREALEKITKYDRDKSYAWYKIAKKALEQSDVKKRT